MRIITSSDNLIIDPHKQEAPHRLYNIPSITILISHGRPHHIIKQLQVSHASAILRWRLNITTAARPSKDRALLYSKDIESWKMKTINPPHSCTVASKTWGASISLMIIQVFIINNRRARTQQLDSRIIKGTLTSSFSPHWVARSGQPNKRKRRKTLIKKSKTFSIQSCKSINWLYSLFITTSLSRQLEVAWDRILRKHSIPNKTTTVQWTQLSLIVSLITMIAL